MHLCYGHLQCRVIVFVGQHLVVSAFAEKVLHLRKLRAAKINTVLGQVLLLEVCLAACVIHGLYLINGLEYALICSYTVCCMVTHSEFSDKSV